MDNEGRRIELLREAAELYRNCKREAGETDEMFFRRQGFLEGRMVGLTETMAEHPSFMEQLPCHCDACRSEDCH